MKRLPVILLIGIPAASVVMGAITLYLATRGPSQEIEVHGKPLDKTSWQHAVDPDSDR